MSDIVDLLSYRPSPGVEEAEPPLAEAEFIPLVTMSITVSVRELPDEVQQEYEMELLGVDGLSDVMIRDLYRWAFLEIGKSMRMGIRRRKKGER